jgi:hypothetical protein
LTRKQLKRYSTRRIIRRRHSEEKGTTQTTQRSIKERSVCHRQQLPLSCLGEQQHARAVHKALTLHRSHTQFPTGTSKKRPLRDSQSAPMRHGYEGKKVPQNGPAEGEVPKKTIITDFSKHVQVSCLHCNVQPR